MTNSRTVRASASFYGVPDGEIHPKRFNLGDEITGDLAKEAIAAGWAPDPHTPAEEIQAKHVGRGKWCLVQGQTRISGPFMSKEAAEAARAGSSTSREDE